MLQIVINIFGEKKTVKNEATVDCSVVLLTHFRDGQFFPQAGSHIHGRYFCILHYLTNERYVSGFISQLNIHIL